MSFRTVDSDGLWREEDGAEIGLGGGEGGGGGGAVKCRF